MQRGSLLNLSETIAWKLVLPIPIFALVAILCVWWFLPNMVEHSIRQDAVGAATQTVTQLKAIRDYYTKNVVKKAIASGVLTPSFNHKTEPNGIPLPATFIHDMSELLQAGDMTVNLFSEYPFPNRKARELDEFQHAAWAYLTQFPDENYVRQELRRGRQIIRVGIADKLVAEACVSCHNSHADSPKKGWKLGDVRGVMEISTAIDARLAQGAAMSRQIMVGTVVGALLLIIVSLVTANTIIKPLTRMTETMKAVAGGDHHVEVPASGRKDELGRMAEAVQIFKRHVVEKIEMEREQYDQEVRAKSENSWRY